MDIRIVKRLHEIILSELTGSPKELAFKLGVSERSVFTYLCFMKTELNAPIVYNMRKESYCYRRVCGLCFWG